MCSPSSVPEGNDEQAEEHVEAVTICETPSGYTARLPRIRTAKLLFEPSRGLERKHSGSTENQWPLKIRLQTQGPLVLADCRPQHSFCIHCPSSGGGGPSSTTSFASPSTALELSFVSPVGLHPSSAPSCQTLVHPSMCPNCERCLVVRSGHGPQAEVAQGVGPGPLVEL